MDPSYRGAIGLTEVPRMRRLEFWPDYRAAPLGRGRHERRPRLLELPDELVREVAAWLAGYDDAKLPCEDGHDDAWLADGRRGGASANPCRERPTGPS